MASVVSLPASASIGMTMTGSMSGAADVSTTQPIADEALFAKANGIQWPGGGYG